MYIFAIDYGNRVYVMKPMGVATYHQIQNRLKELRKMKE